ncbi:hypothetical protein [uncultured Jannaschia sp.]|uniref:hypothetical protein n=1 Tax=uncultured Jannaschia sp. TaxID=293347 RepID=UPI002618387B|nr:hypothetical protein [uncultured Jannaschia sp.]
MTIFPIGALVLTIWAVIAWRSADRALAFSLVVVPFGMLAVMRLPIGGLTPLASHALAALSIGLLAVGLSMRRKTGLQVIPAAGLPLILLAAYAVFASLILVRYFAGSFLVFAPGRNAGGVLLSNDFAARLSPLSAGPSNLSQTAYLLLSIAFFFAVSDVIRRRGPDFLIAALRAGAILNIALGSLDLVGLDALIRPFRTANYNLLDTHTVAGFTRIVGGFAEASAFGPVSAVFATFFLVQGHIAGGPRDLITGAGNALFAVLSLSSTSFLCLGVLALFLLIRALRPLVLAINQRDAFALIAGTALATALMTTTLLSDVLGDLPARVLDKLFFSKAQSASGLERAAMARYGIITLWETNGFGAGIGSVRANGFFSALLAATGLPGLLLTLWFAKAAFVDGTPAAMTELYALRRASQAAALVSLAAASASSFSVDPGLVVMLFAALSNFAWTPDPLPRFGIA